MRLRAGMAVVFLMLIAAAALGDVCSFITIESIVTTDDGDEWHRFYYKLVCTDGGNGGNGGGNGGGNNNSTPFPPVVRITSASDEDPHQVTLRFDYTGGGVPTSMTLRKNGTVVSSGAPSDTGFYGSLDNMIYNSVLTVEMCNSDGCGEAYTDVARTTHRPQVEGAVSAQWQDAIPIDPYNIRSRWDTKATPVFYKLNSSTLSTAYRPAAPETAM